MSSDSAVLAVILTMRLVAWEPWPGPSTPPPGGPSPYPAPYPAPYPSQEESSCPLTTPF